MNGIVSSGDTKEEVLPHLFIALFLLLVLTIPLISSKLLGTFVVKRERESQ